MIRLPPIRPLVAGVRLHGGTCRRCGRRFTAQTPVGLEPGAPFGAVAAPAVYLRVCHAIGFGPLSAPFAEVFGLAIGEGALASLFKLCQAALRRPGRWAAVYHPILMDRLDPFWHAGLDSQMHHVR